MVRGPWPPLPSAAGCLHRTAFSYLVYHRELHRIGDCELCRAGGFPAKPEESAQPMIRRAGNPSAQDKITSSKHPIIDHFQVRKYRCIGYKLPALTIRHKSLISLVNAAYFTRTASCYRCNACFARATFSRSGFGPDEGFGIGVVVVEVALPGNRCGADGRRSERLISAWNLED